MKHTNVNNEFFKVWSPELAYVVGFFTADGSMSNYNKFKRYYVRFCCCDLDIIEKIKDVCGYTGNIINIDDKRVDRNSKRMYNISFTGEFIWNYFTDLGFNNLKTYNAEVPKQLPIKYSTDFIRGLFDGDGSVSVRRINYPSTNIVGTYKVIEYVTKYIKNFNSFRKHKSSSSIWIVDYSGDKAIEFLNKIYKDSTIHMDRKYEKYLSCLGWENKCVRWTEEETNFIKENYLSMYAKDIAKVLDRSISGVCSKAKKLGLKRIHKNGKI